MASNNQASHDLIKDTSKDLNICLFIKQQKDTVECTSMRQVNISSYTSPDTKFLEPLFVLKIHV